MTERLYQESGKASALSIVLTVLSGTAALSVFTYVYSLFLVYIPIVYLNVISTTVLAFIVSYLSQLFNRTFKIRNHKKSILITLVIGVIAVYLQWVWYVTLVLSFDSSPLSNLSNFFGLCIRPDSVIQSIIDINTIGVWEFFGSPVTGLILWGIWCLEAGIIIFVAYNNYRHFEIIPFSEKDNTWFKKEYINVDFEYIAFKQKFIDKMETNASDAILQLEKGHGIRYSKTAVFRAPTEQKSLVSIDNIIVTQRGKGSKDITKVLPLMYVDNHHLVILKKIFEFKKTSIFEF
ncbi:MAG: hypothetical protein ACJA1H_001945 [Glaciecola sp.]|jgi:hypothetical protein